MEQFDYRFNRVLHRPFDRVPAHDRFTVFGVDYVRVTGRQGGTLYVTRHGWSCLESVLPKAWFDDDRFKKVGRALAGATGAVYRVPVEHRANENYALVVKFSRAAQDISVTLIDRGDHLTSEERERIEQAEFLSPFAEFGNISKLRTAARSAILAKQPLAIYSPPTRYLDWQLGRKSALCTRMDRAMEASQQDAPEDHRIHYDWERLYILLYRWVDGIDAEAAAQAGQISMDQMIDLGQEARLAMRRFGWMVCDHKPRHVILRNCRNSKDLLRRRHRIKWALIDYELLVPL